MPKIRRLPVRQGYDLWAGSYDHTDNPVVAIDNLHALPLLAPQSGEGILDAGCGTGRHLAPLLQSGAHATGLDFSAGMLEVARRKVPAARLVQADLQAPLPFRDHSFDAVLCALIGEHLPRLPETFREFRRVLAPSGRLLFTVYHPALALAGKEANFVHGGTEYRLGAVLYTTADYLALLQGAGFPDPQIHEFKGDPFLTPTFDRRPVILALQTHV